MTTPQPGPTTPPSTTPPQYPAATDTIMVGFTDRGMTIPIAVRRASLATLTFDLAVSSTDPLPRVFGVTSEGQRIYLAELAATDDPSTWMHDNASAWLT